METNPAFRLYSHTNSYKIFNIVLTNNIIRRIILSESKYYRQQNITAKQKEDEFKLFDKLDSSGLLDMIIGAMDPDEFEYLYNSLETSVQHHMQFKNSAAALLQSVIQDLPGNAAAAAEIINNWNPEQFQSVQDMVRLARETGMNPSLPIAEPAPAHEDNVVNFLEEQAKQETPQE